MANLYGVLKVVHVLAVVVWIGGAAALGALVAWLARSRDLAALAAFIPLAGRYGRTMGGSSSILVLLSDIGMMIGGKVGMSLWTGWDSRASSCISSMARRSCESARRRSHTSSRTLRSMTHKSRMPAQICGEQIFSTCSSWHR